MTEQETPEPVQVPEQEIEFHGRKIRARMPSPEQLLVWKRTMTQLQTLDERQGWTAEKVMTALERLRKIIDTVLADPADIEWMDDKFLDGTLTFETATPIVTKIIDAFADAAEAEGNRATRRSAAKKTAKKAVRKAAAQTPKVAS